MASIYVHMSGRDVDDALLNLYGLKEKKAEEEHDKPSRCPRCSEINPPNFKFCGKCGIALDQKAVHGQGRKDEDGLFLHGRIPGRERPGQEARRVSE